MPRQALFPKLRSMREAVQLRQALVWPPTPEPTSRGNSGRAIRSDALADNIRLKNLLQMTDQVSTADQVVP